MNNIERLKKNADQIEMIEELVDSFVLAQVLCNYNVVSGVQVDPMSVDPQVSVFIVRKYSSYNKFDKITISFNNKFDKMYVFIENSSVIKNEMIKEFIHRFHFADDKIGFECADQKELLELLAAISNIWDGVI